MTTHKVFGIILIVAGVDAKHHLLGLFLFILGVFIIAAEK